ncbi:unnamed protein product [Heterobilharzia americana]|nr:unnamed protein product [Heterobilharzia americana]
MSSQSNGSIFSARNTETNTSNDIKYESFGLPYIFNQPSMVITDNTSSINPTLSYLNNLNCWSNKAISNMEVTTLSSGIDFMPTSYFNEQEKLQKLQLQILQLEQKAKDNQNITKDYRSKENKLECFNGININPVDGNIPIQLWNNLRMIPDIFACNNPTLGENSSHHNSYRGLGVQDIPQLTFLNQMYSRMDMEHSDQSSHIPGNHSNVLTTEATRTYPYKTFPSVSLQNPSSIGLSSEQDQLLHYAKSQNTLLTEQLFNDLCTLQIESQRQQQANPFFRDNISELFRYSNLFQLNDTMHTGNQAFYSSSDSLGQVLPHNSISQSINNNNNTLITDANNNSSVNTLAYAQALMMVMNAVYGNYKTVETSDQSVSNFTSQSNGSNLMQIGSVNNSYQQAKSLNPEPKESFSEVLTFLSKCLNDPTNHNDKRQSQSYVKQSQQTSGPICTKPATLKLSGRQKTHDGNNQTNQSTSSTTHRGRGRPPKLVGTQYQTQSKQQSQSKQNSLMTSNDRQSKVSTQRMTSVTSINSTPNLDHNCSQLKTEYPSTYSKLKTDVYKSVTGESTELLPYLTFNEVKIKKDLESQEQKIFSPMNNRNGSSIEETIDEVLQSIADYKEDLVTLATQLASDSSLINIHTASEFTSSTPDTKGSSLTCTGQSRSRKSYSSERNPETVNKNVGQLGMLGETIYSNSLRQNLSTPKNSQDITETTSDFFSQPRLSESKYAKKCTLPVHSSLKTSIDPEVSNDYMRIKEEMKSSQSIDLTSSYPSKKRNNSSNITSHEFYTPKNSYLESNQMNIFPSNIYTSFQGSYSQNQQSSQVLSEQAYYDMFNNISQQGSVNLSHLNSTWSNFSHTVADTIQQQKFSEKEYLKNFFIEFVKQQEKVKREKDCLAMEERKQLRETKIQELIEQELRKPIEDLRLINLKPIPKFDSIPGNRMSGKMFGNCLMIIEFLHAFKDILNLDSETIPNLREFQSAFIDRDSECQQILIHLLIELLRLATEDPGIASSRLVTQLLGQKFSETEFNESNISGILRAFIIGRNGHEDDMSDWLKPPVQFIDLNGDQQAALLAFICDELICSSRLISIEVDKAIEQQLLLKREKWIIESRIRRLRLLIAQKSTIGTNSIISSMEYEREGKCDILSSEAYGIKDEDEITHLEKSYIPLKRYSKPITKFNTEGGQYSGNQKSYKRDTIVKSTCVIDTMMVQSNSVTVAGSSTCEEITSSPTLVKTVNSSVIPLNSCITSTDSFILSEDEDNMHKTYELEAKIKILNNAVEQKQREIDECSSKLSGIFLGQDRYYRNYYVLKHMGGIFIESEPCINIYSKDEYCSNRLRSKISENYITSIDSLSNSLPDSHPDYIVGVIEAYRTLAQQRHLKLTTSTINSHLYTQTSTIQSINKSEISIEKLQSVDKSL